MAKKKDSNFFGILDYYQTISTATVIMQKNGIIRLRRQTGKRTKQG
jgi:hypothetical protein